VSEPAVSEQIKALELAVGQALLVRAPGQRSLGLTAAGEILAREAEQILASVDAALRRLKAVQDAEAGIVRLGAGMNFTNALLPSLLAKFRRLHPDIAVEVVVAGAHYVADSVADGSLDLAIATEPTLADGMLAEHLADFDSVLIAPPSHPQAQASNIPLQAISGERLIVANSSLAKQAFERLAEGSAVFEMAWNTSLTDGQVAAVSAQLGIALALYFGAAPHIARGELAILQVDGFPIRLSWELVHRRQQSEAAKLLRRYLLTQREVIEAQTLVPARARAAAIQPSATSPLP
jgi:DNA-binding transcriptional LysR family regulator